MSIKTLSISESSIIKSPITDDIPSILIFPERKIIEKPIIKIDYL